MKIKILGSALKHGISKENIISCMHNLCNDMELEYAPSKRIFVGFDNLGRALEIIGTEIQERDCVVIFHAMKLRKQFSFLLPNGEI